MLEEMKEVIMNVRCSIREADKYARESVKHRHDHPELSTVYARIANDKLEHVNMLHSAGKEMIEKNGDAYAKQLWTFEHELASDDVLQVKRMISQYK